MIYILRKSLRNYKSINRELQKIHGLGHSGAAAVTIHLQTNPKAKIKILSETKTTKIQTFIKDKNIPLNLAIREKIKHSVLTMVKQRAYRGLRHLRKRPVRGQRTHNNAITAAKFIPRHK